MAARIYPWLVLIFWTTTMSWLVASKVLPPLLGGHPPDYVASLSPDAGKSRPVCWRISWSERRIGTALSQVVRQPRGGTALRQVVHFDRLPLDAMLSEGFGLLGSVLKPLLAEDRNLEIEMQLATEIRFDAQQQFTEFQTVVDIAHTPGFLQLQGVSTGNNTLAVTTRLGQPIVGAKPQVMRHEINLPHRSLISDAFAPQPELRNLQVGQKWTIPIYRPFPPNSSVQIVEAIAARLDVIVWSGRDVETILVEYREDAGSGLHVAREPILREWVHTDGKVLKQEMRISGLNVMFERLTVPSSSDDIDRLDPAKHPRLWILDAANRESNPSFNPQPKERTVRDSSSPSAAG